VFPTNESIRSYVSATIAGANLADQAEALDVPFRTRSAQAVFVAEKAS
jgi:hypothetical protein